MRNERPSRVAIVDYGMGNLFSVLHACETVGLRATVTAEPGVIQAADAVILPGVGAFGRAMESLDARGLSPVLRSLAAAGRPLFGICLGMQLLMEASEEFGYHPGLGIVAGCVRRLPDHCSAGARVKVPQVGWNRVRRAADGPATNWSAAGLDAVNDGDYMYFVHSYYVIPASTTVIAATAEYSTTYCAALVQDNVVGWQFHPERSGPKGIAIYATIAARVTDAITRTGA